MRQGLLPSPEQKEKAQHGEHIFPMIRYRTVLHELYPTVTAHWHEEAELTLITQGECIYQIHLETYRAKKGDLIFIPPAVLHSITAESKAGMHSETYVFHMNFLGANTADICSVRYLTPILNQELQLPFVIQKEHPAYETSIQLFMEISKCYESAETGYEIMLKSLLLQFIGRLLPYGDKVTEKSQIQTEHIEKLKQVLEYIEQHYTEELSVSQLAGICYFSEYHFMRFFKKYVGMPCLEYIKNLRLEKAAKLLEQGEYDTLEISLSAGFHNLSYFHREFKKKYGMTPKKYSACFRIKSPQSHSGKIPHLSDLYKDLPTDNRYQETAGIEETVR